MNEIVYDGAICLLFDERIERIISFGEEVEHIPDDFYDEEKTVEN